MRSLCENPSGLIDDSFFSLSLSFHLLFFHWSTMSKLRILSYWALCACIYFPALPIRTPVTVMITIMTVVFLNYVLFTISAAR